MPIAPEPTMSSFLGWSCRVIASLAAMTLSPSNGVPGRARGTAPVAMRMFLHLRVAVASPACSVSSGAKTCTLPGVGMWAWPAKWVILFFLKRKPTPLLSWSATPRDRPMTFSQLWATLSAVMPHASASCFILWYSSAPASRALVGMQPQFRHTPPSRSRSTQATFMPSWAARIAPT